MLTTSSSRWAGSLAVSAEVEVPIDDPTGVPLEARSWARREISAPSRDGATATRLFRSFTCSGSRDKPSEGHSAGNDCSLFDSDFAWLAAGGCSSGAATLDVKF